MRRFTPTDTTSSANAPIVTTLACRQTSKQPLKSTVPNGALSSRRLDDTDLVPSSSSTESPTLNSTGRTRDLRQHIRRNFLHRG